MLLMYNTRAHIINSIYKTNKFSYKCRVSYLVFSFVICSFYL